MGLLNGTTQSTYYNANNSANYGNYQFTTMQNIIDAFMFIYVGEGKIISKINRTDVQFHAMRAIQELSYDVLKSFKSQEIEVPNTLSMILPQDYVNYIKLVRVGQDGLEYPLYPASRTSDPFAVTQNTDGTYDFGTIKRKYTITVPNDVYTDGAITTYSGAIVADGDYLSLWYKTGAGTLGYMYFIFDSDNDMEDGTNPLSSLDGPRFTVTYTVGMNEGQILEVLKAAIDDTGRFTTELLGDNLVVTHVDDLPTSGATVNEGLYSQSDAPAATDALNTNGWAFTLTQDNVGPSDNVTEQVPSNTAANFQSDTPTNYQLYDINYVNDVEISPQGRRYGLDPSHAQMNGSYFIDNLRGLIKFGSSLAGITVTLHYVSDGLGDDSEMVVHKFCEEACYKHIAYGVLSTRSNIPEYLVQRFKKERFAETRKAKIRLSNIKIEEFTQVLRGMGKQIK
tara:strand:- start:443 stop:1798 length:1356 start_codon:yes stop_codon:yes gene_type:complete